MAGLIRELTAASSFEATDIFEITKDPSGTPLSRKATGTQLLSFVQATSAVQNRAAADPTANDDTGDGYRVGDLWYNTSTKATFVCEDNTSTAAVWKHISSRWQVLDTQTPTGSATISLPTSGAFSSLYNDLMIEINGLQHNDVSNRNLQFQISDDGTNWSVAINALTGNVAAATAVYGFILIRNYRSTDPKQILLSVGTGTDTLNNTVRHGWFTTETGAMSHGRLVWGGGTNTNGSIKAKAV